MEQSTNTSVNRIWLFAGLNMCKWFAKLSLQEKIKFNEVVLREAKQKPLFMPEAEAKELVQAAALQILQARQTAIPIPDETVSAIYDAAKKAAYEMSPEERIRNFDMFLHNAKRIALILLADGPTPAS